MRVLASFVALCAAIVAISACVGTVTASPASAGKPPAADKDVRVINTAAEAVPVAVTSLPAVQIGNGAGSPIPVVVSNLPANPERFQMRVQAGIPGDSTFDSVDAYTVPDESDSASTT